MKRDIIINVLLTFVLITTTNLFLKKPDFNKPIKADLVSKEKSSLLKFGLPANEYNIKDGKIEPGMYLGKLFSLFEVKGKELSEILKKTKNVFDVRKIKRGNAYHAFLSKDSTAKLQQFVYEINKVDYVVFDLKNEIKVYTAKKPVKLINKEAAVIVNGSLWVALKNIGVEPLLANELSEIYAWTIDFFALQKGDRFKILYNEKTTDSGKVGVGEIEAAYFEHNGEIIYAIPFKQDSCMRFYNADGQSLKKAFLKAPLKYSRISSHFSNARKHPILKIVRPHHGVDYSAPAGTPVFALGDGIVIHAAYSGGAGNFIKIRHNSVYTTGYMHLRAYAKGIKPGVRVKQGQLIGYVGSTGLSTGPHLDFRVWQNGKAVNPLKLKAGPGNPIKPEFKAEFDKTVEKYKEKLAQVVYTEAKTEI